MTDELQAKLRALRLPCLAKHWDQDLQEAARQRMSHAACSPHIVEEEVPSPGDRAWRQRPRRACLPEP
ncbi:MAG: ATP-binding protein [Verrucomicrobia bacterium]|nr:ATP-binding protein [Verrucomicrobiota bacterium]